MDEADLIGIHEARIAHHVAAIGEIDGEDGAAAVGDGAGAVVVELFVVVRSDVAAGENVFEVLGEGRIDGHQVFEHTVLGAFLDHEDFAIAFDDLGFDFADGFGEKNFVIGFAINDSLANFGDAAGAQRIGFARPAEWRFSFW